ncbi:MAG: hypothetical protein KAI29_27395, partial [Cyclobacteriaceae bacterium]|nr:hypothetical protein [Cyclobacteriaceae bacterium]
MKSLNSVRRNFTLVLPVILFLVTISCYSPDKDESANHPMIILKDERVMEIRNLAKQDELLQEIIDEIFRMAKSVERSFSVVKNRYVQSRDRIRGINVGDTIRWAMVTPANIQISGRKATLRYMDKELYVSIVAPSNAFFEALFTKPKTKEEKQNEGTSMLAFQLISDSEDNDLVISLSSSSVEGPQSLIPKEESTKEIGKKSAAMEDIRVTALGKTYTPVAGRVAVSGSKSWHGDGGPSIRNNDLKNLDWKKEGYFQRNRDVGQVFLAKEDIHLDALVIRIGPEENAVGAGAPGAELFLQFFEVIGEPVINDNGTPQGTDSKHGFSKNHRCDDFIDGITYRSIHIARGGIFPDLPPTMDMSGNPTGDETAIYQYLRFDLLGKDELVFKGGKRYAFMLGFVERGPERTFAVGNWNHAKHNAPASLTDKYDTYHDGWALRREGDGTIPPTMISNQNQPSEAALLEKLLNESLF